MTQRAKVRGDAVTLAHGSGGKAMRDLIDDIFTGTFDAERTEPLEDQARFELAELTARGDRLAMTTDSYVVDPLFSRAAISASWRSAARSMISRSVAPNHCI